MESSQPLSSLKVESEAPPLSEWSYVFPSFKILWRMKDIPYELYLVHSRFEVYPFYFWMFYFASIYYFWASYISPHLPYYWFLSKPVVLSLFSIALISCFRTCFTDPGYLPWNWAVTKKTKFTDDEMKAGKATNEKQFAWAKTHQRPSRSTFSIYSGYFILKADHRCKWLNNWVGLRNQKFFVLSLLYLGICLFIHLFSLYLVFHLQKVHILLFIFYLVPPLVFFVFVNEQLLRQLYRISKNKTYMETLKNKETHFSNGIKSNWEEVFGTIMLLPLWLFPVGFSPTVDGFHYPEMESDDEPDPKPKTEANPLYNFWAKSKPENTIPPLL